MKDKFFWVILVVGIVGLLIVPGVFMYKGQQDCNDKGGVYAKTVTWFECVVALP